ncbi:MAG: DUF3189 family protein [Dethiobacteria bacterium]|jgi:hypothetical protein|nr:DUF3189 family protein [Bacillota bacterium]NMD33639.1 DUF3189 family protein [Bacillota bacterium]HOB28414.1 DUF3189 family protein [Bacillota bacterium]HPZ41206.1 DUF3189 family protein [Bacillota bacterium]HQD51965.1 DUF3189 family protein [Bacillota bacterium]
MIVIFQCFGGTHTSVAAAAIYLGKLPRSRVPRLEELLALPYFDRVDKAEIGTLNYAGRDRQGHLVFILGSGCRGTEVRGLLSSFVKLAGARKPVVAVIDCFPEVIFPVRLGGFISRRLGLTSIGRPLVGRGILRSYPRLVALVNSFEKDPTPYILN